MYGVKLSSHMMIFEFYIISIHITSYPLFLSNVCKFDSESLSIYSDYTDRMGSACDFRILPSYLGYGQLI